MGDESSDILVTRLNKSGEQVHVTTRRSLGPAAVGVEPCNDSRAVPALSSSEYIGEAEGLVRIALVERQHERPEEGLERMARVLCDVPGRLYRERGMAFTE